MKTSPPGEPARPAAPTPAKTAVRGCLARLLPEDPTVFRGPPAAATALAVVNTVGTARSVVHLLAPDSGAGTIAAMPVDGEGAATPSHFSPSGAARSCSKPPSAG